jgi:hypothetical protein
MCFLNHATDWTKVGSSLVRLNQRRFRRTGLILWCSTIVSQASSGLPFTYFLNCPCAHIISKYKVEPHYLKNEILLWVDFTFTSLIYWCWIDLFSDHQQAPPSLLFGRPEQRRRLKIRGSRFALMLTPREYLAYNQHSYLLNWINWHFWILMDQAQPH